MPRTANFHEQIADARLPQAADVGDDAAPLDATVDVLEVHATTGETPMRSLLRACAPPASRLPGRHDALYPGERAGQEAQIMAPSPRSGGSADRRTVTCPWAWPPFIGGRGYYEFEINSNVS